MNNYDARITVPDFAACTIVAHNYLPLAKIVARSFKQHHPESAFYIVVIDRPSEARSINEPGIHIVPITDIDFGSEGFGLMATIYDVTEFATSVKPFALKHLLKSHECVLYLDPDIKVYSRLDDLVMRTVETGWSVTPHCLQPIPRTGAGPTEQEIMGAGVYNLGYIGVSQPLVTLLDWWGERLRRDSIIDVERQLFTDQRWIDLAVGIFHPYIERSTGYNVAYWNLDQREMSRAGEMWMVDNEPLKFFHFSGYDPLNPHWMSKYQPGIPRVLFSERPELIPLFEEYGKELLGIRPEGEKIPSYGWAEPFPGFQLSRGLRRLFRKELLRSDRGECAVPPAAFSTTGLADFLNWCKSPAEESPSGLPRFAQAVFESSHYLQSEFHWVNDGDLTQFNIWVRRHGAAEYIEFELFSYLELHESRGHVVLDSAVNQPRDIGRQMPGVDVVGYLKAELGVGEAGRLAVAAMRANGIEVNAINCSDTMSRQDHPFEVDNVASHHAILMAVNADQLGNVRHSLGREFFDGRYVIGQWFWELSTPPDNYKDAFGLLHEVWAPTRFIQESLMSTAPDRVKIVYMPLPIKRPQIDLSLTKQSFGLPGRYTFLFTFDFLSVMKRKNTLGLVEAFCIAFLENEGPILVLKSINGTERLSELEKLKWAVKNRSDIILIDEYFDANKSASLMAVADCYVSLHRSEGLGLTMAEAMTLGKPVIATGYSGNIDFMTDKNSILIPWKLVKVGKGAEGYPENAEWADPDLTSAATAMRKLYLDPEAGVELGRLAQIDLAQKFSVEETGKRMKNHLTNVVWR